MLALLPALVLAALDWTVLALERRRWDYGLKPAVVIALLFGVATHLQWSFVGPARFFLPALVFCLLGDVLLLVPKGFLAGLASFFLAHMAFILGLFQPWQASGLVPVVAAIWGVFLWLLFRAFRGPKAWRAPIVVYSLALAGLLLVSLNAALQPRGPWPSRALAAAGGTLFFVSDALLAWSRFVRVWRGARLQARVLYHLALLALAAWLLA